MLYLTFVLMVLLVAAAVGISDEAQKFYNFVHVWRKLKIFDLKLRIISCDIMLLFLTLVGHGWYYEAVYIDYIILILQLFGQQEYFGTRKMKNMMKLQLFFLTHWLCAEVWASASQHFVKRRYGLASFS
jgi:hypothetical protein